MNKPTNRDELIAFLRENPRVYCHHFNLDESGYRTYQSSNDYGINFIKGDGSPAFCPLGCNVAPQSVHYNNSGFVLTMFGVGIKYEYVT
jgi:hypothetical protein